MKKHSQYFSFYCLLGLPHRLLLETASMTMIPQQMVHVAAVALLTLALAGIDWPNNDRPH